MPSEGELQRGRAAEWILPPSPLPQGQSYAPCGGGSCLWPVPPPVMSDECLYVGWCGARVDGCECQREECWIQHRQWCVSGQDASGVVVFPHLIRMLAAWLWVCCQAHDVPPHWKWLGPFVGLAGDMTTPTQLLVSPSTALQEVMTQNALNIVYHPATLSLKKMEMFTKTNVCLQMHIYTHRLLCKYVQIHANSETLFSHSFTSVCLAPNCHVCCLCVVSMY